MHPFRRPSSLLPSCSQCFHRPISTTVTATRKRRKVREYQKQIDKTLQERASTLRTRIHEARVARREDWILGPLAPKREIGDNQYGTISEGEMKGITRGLARGVLTRRTIGGVTATGKVGRKGVGMSWEESLICEGDMVAIVSGRGPETRDMGKIGMVKEVRRQSREVVIDGFNKADVNTNQAHPDAPGTAILRTVSLPIPLSCVRLVRKLPDPNTGILADKIISRLIRLPAERKAEIRAEFKAGSINKEELKKRLRSRTIPGSKEVYGDWLEIPMPRPSNNKKIMESDSDTLRYEVEEKTWTPTLLRAPMPDGVIDELRNKYSRFRTRHEPGYQASLEKRERRRAAYKAWAQSGGNMLVSPAKEARRLEKEKLKEKGEPTLEREVLERIGEVMARKGIEITGKRRRDMARNLRGERVVKWGDDVVVQGKKRAETAVLESEEEEEEEDDDDEYGHEEEKGEWEEISGGGNIPIEEDKTRQEKRPTL